MVNCGIIGFGKMGRIRAQAVAESGSGRVVSVCDAVDVHLPDEALRVSNPQELIQNNAIDAVFICTPNCHNEPLTIQALNEGKHVFCEKPPAFTSAGVARIREAEKKSGKCLMYGFNHRHHESIRKMKQLVDSGEMGRILWMRGRYGKEVDESFFEGWRAKPELAGGGIMLDQGIHMLDLMIHLSGGFDEVQAMVSNLYWKTAGIEDNAFVNLRSSKTGVCASLHSTMTQWRYLFSLEVFLDGGAMILNGLKTSSGAYGTEDLAIKRNRSHMASALFDSEEHFIYNIDTSWGSEVGAFLECIKLNKPITMGNSDDAMNVMMIMDMIYGRNNESV